FKRGSRDLQLAVRTYPALELSAIEAPARSTDGIYSYDQKYLAWGGEVSEGRELPANIPADLKERIHDLAPKVTAAAGLRGIVRIDFLEVDGEIYVNEVNTIPGSMGAYLWVDPPISRRQLFSDMLAEGRTTRTKIFSTAGSDGAALRSAGAIASKLG